MDPTHQYAALTRRNFLTSAYSGLGGAALSAMLAADAGASRDPKKIATKSSGKADASKRKAFVPSGNANGVGRRSAGVNLGGSSKRHAIPDGLKLTINAVGDCPAGSSNGEWYMGEPIDGEPTHPRVTGPKLQLVHTIRSYVFLLCFRADGCAAQQGR